jgi:hypothetical protein
MEYAKNDETSKTSAETKAEKSEPEHNDNACRHEKRWPL